MNTISIIPQLFINVLQLQNMKHSIVSTFNTNILMKNNGDFEENQKIHEKIKPNKRNNFNGSFPKNLNTLIMRDIVTKLKELVKKL